MGHGRRFSKIDPWGRMTIGRTGVSSNASIRLLLLAGRGLQSAPRAYAGPHEARAAVGRVGIDGRGARGQQRPPARLWRHRREMPAVSASEFTWRDLPSALGADRTEWLAARPWTCVYDR